MPALRASSWTIWWISGSSAADSGTAPNSRITRRDDRRVLKAMAMVPNRPAHSTPSPPATIQPQAASSATMPPSSKAD